MKPKNMTPMVMQRAVKKRSRYANAASVFFCWLLGLMVATQWFAAQVNYHPSLGANIQHIYFPWQILFWAKAWWAQNTQAFMDTGSGGMAVSAIGRLPCFSGDT